MREAKSVCLFPSWTTNLHQYMTWSFCMHENKLFMFGNKPCVLILHWCDNCTVWTENSGLCVTPIYVNAFLSRLCLVICACFERRLPEPVFLPRVTPHIQWHSSCFEEAKICFVLLFIFRPIARRYNAVLILYTFFTADIFTL